MAETRRYKVSWCNSRFSGASNSGHCFVMAYSAEDALFQVRNNGGDRDRCAFRVVAAPTEPELPVTTERTLEGFEVKVSATYSDADNPSPPERNDR